MTMIKNALSNFRKALYKKAAEIATRLFLCLVLPALAVQQVFFLLIRRKGKGYKTLYFLDNQGRSIFGWMDVLTYIFGGKEQPRLDRDRPILRVNQKGKPYVFYLHENPVIRIDRQGKARTQVDNRGPEAFREYSDAPVEACQLGHFSLFNRLGFVDLATSVDGLNG